MTMVITNARISSAFLHFVPLFESYFFVLHFKNYMNPYTIYY